MYYGYHSRRNMVRSMDRHKQLTGGNMNQPQSIVVPNALGVCSECHSTQKIVLIVAPEWAPRQGVEQHPEYSYEMGQHCFSGSSNHCDGSGTTPQLLIWGKTLTDQLAKEEA